jgi:outer membrane protein assembly factor BamB
VSGSAAIDAVSIGGSATTVYAGLSDGRVLALDGRTGERRWLTTLEDTDQGITPPPAVGDLNGDGTVEVVAVTSTGRVSVLDGETGSVRATYRRDVPIYTYATVADLDGDEVDELFVRYGDGRVAALEYR